jgi:hypothetical protein
MIAALEDGGTGALFADDLKLRGDLKLLGRAISSGWDITEERRTAVLAKLDALMKSADERIALGASKAMMDAFKANVATFVALLKESEGPNQTNVQVNVSNGIDLSKLTPEQLRAIAGE